MRKIRIYHSESDFVIEVPDDAEVTMNYFNPHREDEGAFSHRPPQGAKRTRLSVKSGGKQVAVFLGVTGFRDEAIKLKRVVEKVIVEKRMSDDGEGNIEWGGSETRELTMKAEGTYQ